MKTIVLVLTVAFGVISSAWASDAPPCPSDGSIVQFFPDSDCTKYWQCSNGVGYLMSCPSDSRLEWNPELNTCDWADAAGCTGEGWSSEGSDSDSSDSSDSESSESSESNEGDEGDSGEGDDAEADQDGGEAPKTVQKLLLKK